MKTCALILISFLVFSIHAVADGPKTRVRMSAKKKGPATPAPFTRQEPTEVGHPVGLYSVDIGGRDLLFLSNAIENGLEQVYLGELAKTRGQTEQVKAIAEVLGQTQTEENKKLARLGAMKGISLAATEAAAQKRLDVKLGKLEGAKFDKVWFEEVVALNQRAVSNYEAAAASSDPAIKSFAESALPLANEKLALVNKMTGRTPRSTKAPGFRTTAPVQQ